MKKGLFITIEGPDGSGKSTQVRLIKQFLSDKGFSAVITREPGGTQISEKIRELVLDKEHPEMDDKTEALLYAAARAQHVAEVIGPAILQGNTVVCDRFIDSSIVYQGFGRKLGDQVRIINDFAVAGFMPDVTFLLKINQDVGSDRISRKMRDRIELEKTDFHNDVFKAYMDLEKLYPERVIGIDADRSILEIHEDIRGRILAIMESRGLCENDL